jgi:3-deoxy-D-manno-octulosonic-acid transferase
MHLERKIAWTAYELALFLAWPVLYLYYLCRSQTDGKYRTNHRARLGLNMPRPSGNGPGRIWFHALSVGEVLSSIPLVLEINRQKSDLPIVFSTATETGMMLARERLAGIVSDFFFMPHDFPWAMHKLVKHVRPGMFVLIETDFWPNLLRQLKRERVFTVLVNGRISPGSYRRYCRLSRLAGTIFDPFDLVFTQTEVDRARFESLGDLAGRVIAAGNLKFESSGRRSSESDIRLLGNEIGLEPGRPVWIAGSTHEGEEEIILRIHGKLKREFSNLLLMIAPRNVARRTEVEELCNSLGLSAGVRSRGDDVSGKAVYLIDTLGELAGMYALSDIAFIGGSLVSSGGHNPLEPLIQGKPACWGPSFFNFHEIETALLRAECGRKISSGDELGAVLKSFFGDAGQRAAMKDAVETFAGFQQGTAERIASVLFQAVTKSSDLLQPAQGVGCTRRRESAKHRP